jgi:[protein-PII] uridylyltransferase
MTALRHARTRPVLRADPPADRAALLAALRAGLERDRARVVAALDRGCRGDAAVLRLTAAADRAVRAVHAFATTKAFPLANPTAGERLAVAATGGYGRRELAPFSDLDLLFLVPYKATPWVEQVVEFVLYALWDLGLKVGHATRSVDECLRRAEADHTIATTLLEVRRLAGDPALVRELGSRFRREVVARGAAALVRAKLDEREARYRRVGETRFVLEPNVKDGIGGLRDVHLLGWLAGFRAPGGPGRAEAARVARVRAYLLTVRCHLHLLAGRADDRLSFAALPELARRLGVRDRAANRRVERFMRRYFLATKEIGDVVRRAAAAADPALSPGAGNLVPLTEDGALAVAGRAIVIADPARARAAPVELMRLFRVAQARGLDVHPSAEPVLARALPAFEALRGDPEACRLFLEILTSTQRPEAILRRMSEVGALPRFLPDFGRVVAQMQYDMVHVYTVDEHSIRAVGMLAAIERGDFAAELPLAAEIFPKIQSRRALYLAVFLHDVAKGRGGDHSETGAVVAREAALRLGLEPEEAETAAWLVQNHLLLSRTAFKRDVNDPQTATDLVALVQSIERLRLLLLLTVADIRATSPALWNGWKGQLLRDLYWRAEEVITGGHVAERKAERVEHAKRALRAALPGWGAADVEAYVARHFPPYWLSFDAATHARHAALVRAVDGGEADPAIDARIDRFRDVTEVTIATRDRPGLFYRVAGAIAIAGAGIADAKIHTLADGVALDTFWIQDHARHAFADEARLERLRTLIGRALADGLDLGAELARRRRPRYGPADPFPVEPRVLIDNGASTKHTVIEVNGRDRPGLLYDVTRALSDLRLSIVTARVSTYGNRAVDTFYVRDRFGLKVERPGAQRHVRERLMAALRGDSAR